MIKVLIAEDHAIVRRGIVSVLQKQVDLEVIGEAENGAVAMRLLNGGLLPDVLLTDINMPEMDGLQLVEQITALSINLPAIVLTMHTDKQFREKAMAAGARGYLLKNGDMDELVACIRAVHSGLRVVGKDVK